METIFSGCTTTLKSRFFAKSDSWVDVRLEDILAIVGDWGDDDLSRGVVGVHLKPVFLGLDGKKYYWPCIDIENPHQHGDISANIGAARQAILYFDEMGLSAGLKVMLSGSGFRFVWPILIPHEYGREFMAWMEDLPFVDAASFKNGFIRLIAYRGHTGKRRQDKGKPPPDIHTQLLSDPAEVFRMTEVEYRRSVSGRLPSGTAAWLDELLPKEFCTRIWEGVLAEYHSKIRFKDAIVRIPRGRNTGAEAHALAQALGHLDAVGITYTEQQTCDTAIFKLLVCPVCGRKDTGAWTTPTGRLKCWSTSCQAGNRNEQGWVIGMPPAEWIPDFEDAPDHDETEQDYTTIEDARQDIAEAINSDDDVLITPMPGVGKTGTALRSLGDRIQDKRVVFAVPTKAKIQEVVDDALELHPGANIHIITGRDKNNCIQHERCAEVAKRGFSPWRIVCYRCHERKSATCEYWKQFKSREPGLIVTTHSSAQYCRADELIIDEDATSSIYREEAFTLDELIAFQADFERFVEGSASVFDKISGAARSLRQSLTRDYQTAIVYSHPPNNIKDPLSIREAAGLTDADMGRIDRLLAFFEPLDGESAGAREWRLYSGIWGGTQMYSEGSLNMKVIDWLDALVNGTGAATIEATRRPGGEDPFQFCCTWKQMSKVKGRLVVLDGTGFKLDHDRIFGRDFRVVDADVPLDGCTFIHHKQPLGKGRMAKMTDAQLKKLLEKLRDYLNPTDRRILIATHKAMEDRIEPLMADVFPGRAVDVIHFNGSRGLNAYKDHDAVALFGTYTKNPLAAWKLARTLHPDDADIADCIKRQSDAENIQTMHRIRPVCGGKTIIIMGREWIPGLPAPGSTISTQRGGKVKEDERVLLDEAYARIERFFRQFGFITKGVSWFLGVGSLDERADVEHHHAMMLRFLQDADTPKNWVSHHIYNILYGDSPKKTGCLILSWKKYWRNILDRLRENHPGAGIIETAQGTVREIFTPGIGTVEKAREFYRLIGTEAHFKPDLWRQVEPAETQKQPFIPLSMNRILDTRGVATIFNFRMPPTFRNIAEGRPYE